MNLLNFSLLLPSNSAIAIKTNDKNDDSKLHKNDDSNKNMYEIIPLIQKNPQDFIGISFPCITLEKDQSYELRLYGKSIKTEEYNTISLTLTFTDIVGPSDKSMDNKSMDNKSIENISYKSIENILGPDELSINLVYKFHVFQTMNNMRLNLIFSKGITKLDLDESKSSLVKSNDLVTSNSIIRRRNICKHMSIPNDGKIKHMYSLSNRPNPRYSPNDYKHGFIPNDYSLLHCMYDKIHVLSFTHDVYKEIKCRQTLSKKLGLYPTYTQISTTNLQSSFDEWRRKTENLGVDTSLNISFENWCISHSIASILSREEKNKVLIIKDDTCLLLNQDFEIQFYKKLYTYKHQIDLFSIKNQHIYGINNLDLIKQVVEKIHASPVPMSNLFTNLAKKYNHLDLDPCLDLENEKNELSSYWHILLRISTNRYMFDTVYSSILQDLKNQTWPLFKCVIIIENVNDVNNGYVEKKILDLQDSRFQIVLNELELDTVPDSSRYMSTILDLKSKTGIKQIARDHLSRLINATKNIVTTTGQIIQFNLYELPKFMIL